MANKKKTDPKFSSQDFDVYSGLVPRIIQNDKDDITVVWRDVDDGAEKVRLELEFRGTDVVAEALFLWKSLQNQDFLTILNAELPKMFRTHGYERVVVPTPVWTAEILEKLGYSPSEEEGEYGWYVASLSPSGKLVRTAKARLK